MSNTPMSIGMDTGLAAFLVFVSAFVMLIYFLPTIIAVFRKSPKTGLVVILNLFFGLTVVGWILALIFAFKEPDRVVYVYEQPPPPPPRQ
jgi:uncharacterized membrane protein YhaH (DUF805 family)